MCLCRRKWTAPSSAGLRKFWLWLRRPGLDEHCEKGSTQANDLHENSDGRYAPYLVAIYRLSRWINRAIHLHACSRRQARLGLGLELTGHAGLSTLLKFVPDAATRMPRHVAFGLRLAPSFGSSQIEDCAVIHFLPACYFIHPRLTRLAFAFPPSLLSTNLPPNHPHTHHSFTPLTRHIPSFGRHISSYRPPKGSLQTL